MTHDEEYMMLEDVHIGARCNGRCSGIGARKRIRIKSCAKHSWNMETTVENFKQFYNELSEEQKKYLEDSGYKKSALRDTFNYTVLPDLSWNQPSWEKPYTCWHVINTLMFFM